MAANVSNVEIQSRGEKPANGMRGAFYGDCPPDRQAQIELHKPIDAAPKVQIERRSHLNCWLEVRHSRPSAGAVASRGCRCADAQIELDDVVVEEQFAQSVVIGSQER